MWPDGTWPWAMFREADYRAQSDLRWGGGLVGYFRIANHSLTKTRSCSRSAPSALPMLHQVISRVLQSYRLTRRGSAD